MSIMKLILLLCLWVQEKRVAKLHEKLEEILSWYTAVPLSHESTYQTYQEVKSAYQESRLSLSRARRTLTDYGWRKTV